MSHSKTSEASVRKLNSQRMELIKAFFFLLLVIFNYEAFKINVESSLTCEALLNLPKSIRLPKMSTIDVFTFVKSEKLSEAFECFKLLIFQSDFAFTFYNGLKQTPQKFYNDRKKQYVGVSVDSALSLSKSLEIMAADHYNQHGLYLIILTTNSTNELNKMFDSLWRSFVYNVNILMQINNSVKMFTFFPFNRDKCHETKPVEINEYKNGKWKTNNFFPSKLRNFYKCRLKASCYEYGPSCQKTIDAKGNVSLSGSDAELLTTLSKVLNASVDIEITTEIGSWGQVWENGSASGAFERIMNGEIDICANFYFLTELRSKFLQFTRAYFSVSLLMMIPKGVQLTAFQKLFRPFQLSAWIFFTGFLFIAFVSVLIIRCRSRKTQLLFFDRNINAPMMEMLVILFGSSQHILPRKSFSRLLLMSFAMYCFVVRTIYTGSLFKFLQVSKSFDNACNKITSIFL